METDDELLVEVHAAEAGEHRTGLLIAPRTVLAAAPGATLVSRSGGRYRCRPVGPWALEITDPDWPAIHVPASRWGATTGWYPARLAGVPGAEVLLDQGAARVRAWPEGAPAAGSAPVLVGDTIVGLASWGADAARFDLVPASAIIADGLSPCLPAPVLETAELDGLLRRWEHADPADPPPAELTRWCHSAARLSGLLVTGPGGTRLGVALAQRLRDEGWDAGLLSSADPDRWGEVLRTLRRPLLVIVPRAGWRQPQVTALLRQLLAARTGNPVRLLLAADSAQGWWPRFRASLGAGAGAFRAAPVPVQDLAAADPEDATQAIAAEAQRWSEHAERLPSALRPAWPEAVLAAVVCGPCTRAEAEAALPPVADREELLRAVRRLYPPAEPGYEYWGTCRLTHAYVAGADADLLRRVLARLSGRNAAAATYLLARADRSVLLADLLGSLPDRYGPAVAAVLERGGPEGPLARALGAFAGSDPTVAACEEVTAAIPRPTGRVAEPWLRLSERLITAYRDADASPQLAAALAAQSPVRAECGDAAAALEAITEAVDHYRRLAGQAPAAYRPFCAAALLALAQRRAEAGEPAGAEAAEALDHWRELADHDPVRHLPELAAALRVAAAIAPTVAIHAEAVAAHQRLALIDASAGAGLGQAARSLAAAYRRDGQATRAAGALDLARDAYEQLAEVDPWTALPDLAAVLLDLAADHQAAGRHPLAAAAAERAVASRRRLAEHDPDGQLLPLVHAMRRLSEFRAAAGQHDRALSVAEDAVLRCRSHQPGPALYAALHTLAIRRLGRGDHAGATLVADQAADGYRRLFEDGQRGYRGHYAAALTNLAVCHGAAGDGTRQERLATTAAAVGHPPAAAQATLVLADAYAAQGRLADSAHQAELAATAYVQLARTQPGQHLPRLVEALLFHSERLAAADRPVDAVAPARLAESLCRARAERGGDAGQHPAALRTLGKRLVGAGHWAESLPVLDAAIEAYRLSPDPGEPAELAMEQALALTELGRTAAAVDSADRAVALYRSAAAHGDPATTARLAAALDRRLDLTAPDAPGWLTAAAEAARTWARLAGLDTRETAPLIAALGRLAGGLDAVGRRTQAVEVAVAAVRRGRSAAEPGSVLPPVLVQLARLFAAGGDERQCLAAGVEAVEVAGSDADRAMALADLADHAWEFGEWARGTAVSRLAAGAYAALDTDDPRYGPAYARALVVLAERLVRQGGDHQYEAYEVAGRAVERYEELADCQPDLARALHLVAQVRVRRYRRPARAAAGRAVALYRELAANDPHRYASELAEARHTLALRTGRRRHAPE